MHPSLSRGTAARSRSLSSSSSSSLSSSSSSSSTPSASSSPHEQARLAKACKYLEMNRKAYMNESQSILAKQAHTLAALQKEHDKLSAEVALEDKTAFLTTTAALAASQQDQALVKRLKEQLDRFTRQNAGARRQLSQLQRQTSILHAKLAQQRRDLGGVDAAQEQDRAVAKRVHRLENQLEKALGKLNKALARNKKEKASIDDLRRERLMFTQLQVKLQKDLDDKLGKMAQVIETCNKAYAARDAAQAESATLEEADRREAQDYEAQLQELAYVFKAKLRRSAMRPNLLLHEHGATATQRRLTLLQVADAKEEKARRKLETQQVKEEIQRLNAFLEEVKAQTGYDDVEEMLSEYLRQEERNFSLYTYVNQEQWKELKGLEAQVAELRAEAAQVEIGPEEDEEDEEDEEEDSDSLRPTHHGLPSSSSSSSPLELQLQAIKDAIKRYEEECVGTQHMLDAVRQGVVSLAMAIHLEGMDVTNGNLLLCLGRIEERMEEIVEAYLEAKKAAKARQREEQQQQQQASSSKPGSSMFKILRLMVEPEEPSPGAEKKDVVLRDGMAAAGAGNNVARNARQRRHHHYHESASSHIEPPCVDDYSDEEEEEERGAVGQQKPMSPQPMATTPTRTSPLPLTRAQVEERLKTPTRDRLEKRREEEDEEDYGSGRRMVGALLSSPSTSSSSPVGNSRKPAKRMSHYFKSFDD